MHIFNRFQYNTLWARCTVSIMQHLLPSAFRCNKGNLWVKTSCFVWKSCTNLNVQFSTTQKLHLSPPYLCIEMGSHTKLEDGIGVERWELITYSVLCPLVWAICGSQFACCWKLCRSGLLLRLRYIYDQIYNAKPF